MFRRWSSVLAKCPVNDRVVYATEMTRSSVGQNASPPAGLERPLYVCAETNRSGRMTARYGQHCLEVEDVAE